MAKILIVEDEAHICRVMSMWLTRQGHSVLQTSNGKMALDVLDRETVDIIISDMNMPILDGLGLAKTVRHKLGLKTPILLVTARCDQRALAEELKPLQVKTCPKPFVPSRLVADIEKLLAEAAVEEPAT